ncbi:MAG: alkaline phosphatase D family protein [Cyclobacteriaceae bacterium]
MNTEIFKRMEQAKFIAIMNVFILPILISCQTEKAKGPYFATGIKIGEVTQSEAIVWVRLTKDSLRIGNDAPIPDIKYKEPETGEIVEQKGRPNKTPVVIYPEGYTVNNIEGACPGSPGKVKLKYKLADEQNWKQLDWQTVDPDNSYATEFNLSGLSAGKKYNILVESASLTNELVGASIEGKFKTAPGANSSSNINFVVTTCTSYNDSDSEEGYKLYPNALKLDPEFFVHAGDILYYDHFAKTLDLARWQWDRMYSFPNNVDFHRQVASYFIKDDHDTWMNDSYPGRETKFMGKFTFEQGLDLFLEQVPMREKTYRTVRWGKNLQIWMVEGRDYRSANTMEDGPQKTIWGKEQMDWFTSTVETSDATFKILISPTPIVGPDRVKKKDNHANSGFAYEGRKIREFISQQENMFVICGDRHWQYISKDAETGVMEFGCGPGSNEHAGGWKQEDKLPEHIYLNVVGGFLEVVVFDAKDKPSLTFRHYDPDGALRNEYPIEQESI